MSNFLKEAWIDLVLMEMARRRRDAYAQPDPGVPLLARRGLRGVSPKRDWLKCLSGLLGVALYPFCGLVIRYDFLSPVLGRALFLGPGFARGRLPNLRDMSAPMT